MKKFALWGALIFFSLLTFFLLSQESQPALSENTKIHTPSSSKELFLGARKAGPPVDASDSFQNPSDPCSDLTSQLELIDFTAPIETWLGSIGDEALEGCKEPILSKQISNLKKHCFDEFQELECSHHAVFLRAALRTRGVEDGEDREILADLILNEFSKTEPDFKKLAQFAEKMMDLDPGQPAFKKLWASSKVISNIGPETDLMDIADEIFDRVGEEIFNTPDMQGLKLAMMTNFKPDSVEQFARQLISENDSPSMREILGWALWRQNRFSEAIKELRQAISLNPNDNWLKEQLRKIESGQRDPESYQARIQLGFNYQDLYN